MWQVLHFLSKALIALLRDRFLAAGESFRLYPCPLGEQMRESGDGSMRRRVKGATMECTVRFVPSASSPSLEITILLPWSFSEEVAAICGLRATNSHELGEDIEGVISA